MPGVRQSTPYLIHLHTLSYQLALVNKMQDLILTEEPTQHPDCCVALSRPLLDMLCSLLPPSPEFTLSIGSGSGLLESLILRCSSQSVDVRGLEVSPSVNKYLDEPSFTTVPGTWAISDAATYAAAWMFVYPREPKLFSSYLKSQVGNTLRLIVWLGPRSDWSDYQAILEHCDLHFELSEFDNSLNSGIASYELLAVVKRL